MKAKSKIRKITSLKVYQPAKTKKCKINSSNLKINSKIKGNFININDNHKISSEIIKNDNSEKFVKYPLNNYIFNYNYISNEEKNKKFRTEKYLKKVQNSCEEDKKKQISIDKILLNISNKIPRTKLSLSKRKINKLSLSILSLNSINNKIDFNKKMKNENDKNIDIEDKVDTLTLSSLCQKSNSIKNIRHNTSKNIKNKLNKNSCELLTESNTINSLYKKSYKNVLKKCSMSRNYNKKIFSKSKSYDGTKKIISKIKNTNLNSQNREITTYIKVNIIHENQLKYINTLSTTNNIINNCQKEKTYKNNNSLLQKTNSQKIIINYNNNDYYNHDKKSMKNIFDICKTENNNIFLDKQYQNRFNKKPKYIKLNNEIFTNEKQKEYNTIIIKKKSNSNINNLVTISTTNSSNSSNNNTSNNHKHNWVHRLYDEEISKQKMRDKMVYLLRKSILNDASPNKPKKDFNRVKEYDYKDNYNKNFNIINFFLSDDKKLKNNRIKRYKQNSNNYEENVNNKIGRDKIKIIRKKRKNMKNKKSIQNFLFLCNDELINEEDEEKEKDDDE